MLCTTGRGSDEAGITCRSCESGKFRARTTDIYSCQVCGTNSASSQPVDDNCEMCTRGKAPDASKAFCEPCAIGEYTPPGNTSTDCIKCPKRGAQCAGGMLTLNDDTWYDFSSTKPLDESRNTYTCFNDESCLYDSSKSVLTCDVSKGYLGPLCGGCGAAAAYGAPRNARRCRCRCVDFAAAR